MRAGESSRKAKLLFRQLLETCYANHHKIYTDGSVASGKVGCGISDGETEVKLKLPDQLSIFSAEALAILIAIERIAVHKERVVIFTDSASCLSALERGRSKHPWIVEISKRMKTGDIAVCWIPGHSGISGNERADCLANEGRELEEDHVVPVPASDAKRWAKEKIRWCWESEWFNARETFLRRIKPTTNPWRDRRQPDEQRVLTRLRIGHTRLTHGYLMRGEQREPCEVCGTALTVEHVLTECRGTEEHRREHRLKDNLVAILQGSEEEEKNLLKFLRATSIFNQI